MGKKEKRWGDLQHVLRHAAAVHAVSLVVHSASASSSHAGAAIPSGVVHRHEAGPGAVAGAEGSCQGTQQRGRLLQHPHEAAITMLIQSRFWERARFVPSVRGTPG